ncbi:MAG: hypothetical protein KGY60_04475 [Bacteroidales bacterium]|nr:hypothetical protein [Bacteroidales bacterium]
MGNLWVQISTIYLAGITGIWKGISVGFAIDAHPFVTAAFTALGSITVVLVLLLSGERLKKWVLGRFGEKHVEKQQGRFTRLMERYGVAVLGLIACGLIGPILSTLLGLALIKRTRRLMVFLLTGVVLWSGLITLMAATGLELASRLLT